MATFKPTVRNKRKDGFYLVYIRVTHKRVHGYIRTDKVVTGSELTPEKEIKDPFVLNYCTGQILYYNRKLNETDVSKWSVSEVIDYLLSSEEDISFSEYARHHINKMINSGHERNAKNYGWAVRNLESFLCSNNVMFSHLTSTVLNAWSESLSNTKRSKEMYPVCVRQIYRAAMLEHNDEERGIVRIKFDPWKRVRIAKSDTSVKRAISAEACREFFGHSMPAAKMVSPLADLGRDVAMMVLCLGGINTVDLYGLRKIDYRGGIICYRRAKTQHSRRDDAYMEMRVEPFLKPVVDKYLSGEEDPYLFIFHQRYCNSDSFNANVNAGIKRICADMGIPKESSYSAYTFRHTWGTIAQNDCDANLNEVAFGLNHSHGFGLTRGYVKIDYSPAWRLNARIIDFVFFSDAPSKQGKARDIDSGSDKLFRVSSKMMIYARAYYKGRELADIMDIGFSNVESVIGSLWNRLPADIPAGSRIYIRIRNCESDREVVYEWVR